MSRLFSEHKTRMVSSLDGVWCFRTDPDDEGEKNKWFCKLPNAGTIAVPSVWNEEVGLLEYEGMAWYERHFYTKGGCLRFFFGAVMTFAKVWLDGNYVEDHYGGFSEFDFIVPDVAEGEHTLTVRADNSFDACSIPQAAVDWYHYGGIIRSVSVETLEGICVLNNRLEYALSDDFKRMSGHFVLECYNASKAKTESELNISIDGKTVFDGKISVPPRERKVITLPSFTMEDVRLWDIGRPELYNVIIATETDDLADRVGFRRVEAKNKSIFLNGREIELRGVNRHEEYPSFGFAFPISRMKHDIDLILDLGCNFVRGSHYPNSRELVDYLDQTGLLFWSEIPIWGCGFEIEALGNEAVISRGLKMHEEMVNSYYNHPCIVFWGMHNEIRSDTPEGLEMTKKYYSYLKRNGGNRLVVYASRCGADDICFAYTDVACLNMYFGWYIGDMSAWDGFIKDFCAHMENIGLSDLPIVFSEFGCAAIYGFHDAERPKWSEEYQAALMEHCLTLFHKHPSISGSLVWQFCDIRTSAEMGFSRARGFNNKGLLNEYRRPKAAYYAVKRCYELFAAEEREHAKQGEI